MPRTMILQLIDQTSLDAGELRIIKDNSRKIKELLGNMKCGENITFQEFLERLQINEEDYIMAERLSLTRNTKFLE